MSGGLGIPRIDFSPLSKLGEDLAIGLNRSERRNAVQGIGVAPGDPQFLPKLGQTLVGLGDIDGALAVSRLQEASQDRAYQRQTSERDFQFRKLESGRSQANADRSFGAQEDTNKWRRIYEDKSATRADQALEIQKLAALRREHPANYEPDPSAPGALRPIPGGPEDPAMIERKKAAENSSKAEKAQPLGGELASRIGLGNQFLDNDLPDIRKKIDNGELGGGWVNPYSAYASAQMATGTGEPGAISRRVSTGIDALMRNLTGAGMSQSEADAYAARYRPKWNDSVPTIKDKLGGLEKDLKATRDAALAGRNIHDPALTGRSSAAPQADRPAAPASASPRIVKIDQVPENARFRRDGKIYRRVNGQDVPE